MLSSSSAAARVRPATPAPAPHAPAPHAPAPHAPAPHAPAPHAASAEPGRVRRASTTLAAASFAALTALVAVAPSAVAQGSDQTPDSTAFVTRLGKDTLAVEHVVRTGNVVEADVLLRTPSTTRTRYRMELAGDGAPVRWASTAVDPRTGAPTGAGETITRSGDSLRVETTGPSGGRVRMVAADAATLPFIDMVHWPFEPALRRLRESGRDSIVQPLLTGARTSDFRLAAIGADSATITHPFRGTMRVRADAGGRLIGLDAGATTRALIVDRRPWLAIDALAARWRADDDAGRSFGALSGRGETVGTVHGAQLAFDYGTPVRRGRAIWGALVPWGELWRTGANLATHLTTDRDLVLGQGADTLAVPAGRYTLFTIPASDGGLLIVNRQTGQNGNSYDAAQDLGRVAAAFRPLTQSVELFTIVADETPTGGLLRLRWADGEMVVPFRVR
ncbi:MAG: DUF2911 domain-containing protein [Gemmatimonadaceae bacterium]